jgi:NADPH-dependent glutamate synthase beta subunit-like oxidoreductase
MGETRRRASYLYYDVDQIIADAERCLECQQKQACVSQCRLGLEIPQAMAAIAQHAFIVREGVREELDEAVAEAYAREAVNESFSYW